MLAKENLVEKEVESFNAYRSSQSVNIRAKVPGTEYPQIKLLAKYFDGDIVFALSIAILSRAVIFLLSAMFHNAFAMEKPTLDTLCAWDCSWYMSIINDGYDLVPHGHEGGDAANWAFFPLFPMAVKAMSSLLGLGKLMSALVVVNASFVLAICILFRFAKKFLGAESARFVILMMAFSPYSLYFSVPYTESVYFLFMVCTLFCARWDKWLLAGVCAAALSATRNLGVFIVFSLLLIAVRQYGWKELVRLEGRAAYATLALFMAPLGLFIYMFFLYRHMGDPLAFKSVQVAWGRAIDNPFIQMSMPFRGGNLLDKYYSLTACVALLAAAYLYTWKFRAEAIVLFIGVLIPASTSLMAMPRYALTLFPVSLALGLATQNFTRLRPIIFGCNSALLGFFVISWMTGKIYMI